MKSKLKIGLFIFGIVAIILTFMPFIAMDYWWVRMFDFPHLQLTGITLLALLTYFIKFDFKFYGDYIFAGFLVFCLIIQVQKIYPYSILCEYEIKNSQEISMSSDLKLLNINVLQKNTSYQKVINEVERVNPDIMVFSEVNTTWKNKIHPSISTKFKYKVEHLLDNTYGILMYSKKKLIDPKVKFLVSDSIPSIETRVLLDNGSVIKLYSIHPTPPMPQENTMSTDRDAEMMMVAKNSLNSTLPVIIIGDFNDVAWSQTMTLFKNVSRLGDVRIGRGFYNTFDANNVLMRWPLDHVFLSSEFRVKYLERGNDVGSDHFPLIAKISFEPNRAYEQKIESPTDKQLERANAQIQKFYKNQ